MEGNGSGNISIVSGAFNNFTCKNESNYTLGRAIASGSRVIGVNAIVGSGFKYAEIQSMTKANYLNVIKITTIRTCKSAVVICLMEIPVLTAMRKLLQL